MGYCFGVYLECSYARGLQLVAVFFSITLLHECGRALATVISAEFCIYILCWILYLLNCVGICELVCCNLVCFGVESFD